MIRDRDDVGTRLADPSDVPFLWEMLTYAASMRPGGAASIADAMADGDLRGYVEGYGRPGDLGVIARDAKGPCGAAWLRLALDVGGVHSAHKVSSAEEPELAIGVSPEARGRGVGGRLLGALAAHARGRYPAIVLSVREENPSVRLYTRTGFVVTGEIVNRVGGRSLKMRLAL